MKLASVLAAALVALVATSARASGPDPIIRAGKEFPPLAGE